nr:hypothetical protein [Tanacetum cinerariifolium]
ELKKDFIKKDCYDTLFQKYNILEKHCISLEVDNQLKKEISQRNTSFSQESAPTFAELFEINDLKAQAQAKDTVILKLREKLHSLTGDVNERIIKRELVEIETFNIELDHKSSPYATSYHTPQYVSEAPSSSNLSISYPLNVIPLTVNHNGYMASSTIPQIDYAPTAHQETEFSSPETGLVVPVFPKGRQNSMTAGSSRPNASGSAGASGKQRVIVCYNCKGEGHMSKQCIKPKRKRDAKWFKDKGLVRGLPKLKFEKDHLCSACAVGKSTKKTHKPKSEDTNQEKLYLLHMDLCGPMRIESVNGKNAAKGPVRRIRTDNGTEFVNQTWRDYYEEVGISHETSVARSPQQNGVVERRNRTLIEAACTIDNLGKLQPKADIGIFIGYAPTKKAFRIYNRRSRRIVETIHVDFDELTAMASEQISSGPALNEMTLATPSSGLVVDNQAPEVIALIPDVIPPVQDDSTILPPSTTIDQDAPSLSKSHTTAETQSSVFPKDVEEENMDIEVAHIGNDPLLGVPIPVVISAQSSTTVSPRHIVQPDHPISQHTSKWTKDHPLNNIIGQLSRPISTRLQLHEQALFCYYDAFLTFVEPKTYKDALTQSCWIEAIQEELNEFERLKV